MPKTKTAKPVFGAALLMIGPLLAAPNASATTFGLNASGSVSGFTFGCGGNTPGTTSATFSCNTTDGSVMASVDFGALSIKSEADNIQATAVGSVLLFVQGTIGGTGSSGTMTWTSSGISGTPGSDLFLTIYTQGGPFGNFVTVLSSTCFGVRQPNCGTAPSMSASAPVTIGEPIELTLQANCGASGVDSLGHPQPLPDLCRLNDPLSLSLSNGLTFNSDVANLFSPGQISTPEPSTLFLLGSGLLFVPWLRKRYSTLSRRKV